VNGQLQGALARVRRIEQHQQTLVNWLNPADQNPPETTIGFEQVAIEVTSSVAEKEPDSYLAPSLSLRLARGLRSSPSVLGADGPPLR
jgi:hypothetical protein